MSFPDTDLDVQILAYLGADPTDDPANWPTPTDLSSRLLDTPMRTTRGRSAGQSSLTSGSCTFDLSNDDGALTPLQATSPYYGTWDLGVPVAVNVDGVGASPPYGRVRGYVADITQTIVPGPGGTSISAVRVTLGGLARQITQGAVEKSAMRRFYEQVSPQPVAYWPLESGDGRAAFSFESGFAGGADLRVVASTSWGVTRPFAAAGGISPGPLGAASATDTSSGGRLSGSVPIVDGATTARGEVSVLADGYEDTFPGIIVMYSDVVALNGFPSFVGVYAQDLGSGWQIGVVYQNPSAANSTWAPGVVVLQDHEWHLVQLDLSSSGGGADTAYVVHIDGEVLFSGTITGQTWSPVVKVDTNTLAVDIDRQAHLAVWSGTSLPDAADSYDAFLGHAGEAAHDRFTRICNEEGIPNTTSATASRALGPQPVGDPFAILQDVETGDHGVLYELADDWGFGYLAARQRLNLDAALTIDLSTYRRSGDDDAGSVLTPVRNDARVRNQWTISTPDGRSATATDSSHQSKHGHYDDSDDANIHATADIANEASWRVHEGTFDGLRYRSMPIDLGANAASPSDLLTPWLETEIGDRIDRTNNPTPEHPYGDTTLILEGYAETITRRSWKVAAVVEPYDPWAAFQIGDQVLGRLDTSGSALALGVDSDDTSLLVATDSGKAVWITSTRTADFPFGIAVGGEVMKVTAISGTTSPQTFTVVRSVNGVTKSHTAGTDVRTAAVAVS